MEWWQILAAVLAVLGIASGTIFALKWQQAMTLLREASEAIVALGMLGLALERAVEDKNITDEERADIIAKCRKVVTEFWGAIAAARALFSKSH